MFRIGVVVYKLKLIDSSKARQILKFHKSAEPNELMQDLPWIGVELEEQNLLNNINWKHIQNLKCKDKFESWKQS